MKNDYCTLFTDLIKKYDILGLIDNKTIKDICYRLKYINKLLIKCHRYIFLESYGKKEAIDKILNLKKDNISIFSLKDANNIYDKFITISQKGGSKEQMEILEKNKEKIMTDTSKIIKDNIQLQDDLKDIDSLNRKFIEKQKKLNQNNIQNLGLEIKNQESIYENKKRDLELKKLNISNLKNKLKSIKKTDKSKGKKLGRYYDDYKKKKKQYLKYKEKFRKEKEVMNSLKKEYITTENKLTDNLKTELPEDKIEKIRNEVIKKDMDMIEIMLISLSLLPIAGWTFDLPLFIYAILKKRYNLAIITVLNWYIWGFWLLFGLNVNMGPSMKVTYLGNKQNYMKNGILTSFSNNKKILDPYTSVQLTNINGKKYAVDKFNNVYEPLISNPKIVGVINPDNGKLINKHSKDYYQIVDKNK